MMSLIVSRVEHADYEEHTQSGECGHVVQMCIWPHNPQIIIHTDTFWSLHLHANVHLV